MGSGGEDESEGRDSKDGAGAPPVDGPPVGEVTASNAGIGLSGLLEPIAGSRTGISSSSESLSLSPVKGIDDGFGSGPEKTTLPCPFVVNSVGSGGDEDGDVREDDGSLLGPALAVVAAGRSTGSNGGISSSDSLSGVRTTFCDEMGP